jgi:hypothetical protein
LEFIFFCLLLQFHELFIIPLFVQHFEKFNITHEDQKQYKKLSIPRYRCFITKQKNLFHSTYVGKAPQKKNLQQKTCFTLSLTCPFLFLWEIMIFFFAYFFLSYIYFLLFFFFFFQIPFPNFCKII